jgi:hypothetical protein
VSSKRAPHALFYSTIVASRIFEPTQAGHTITKQKCIYFLFPLFLLFSICDFRLILPEWVTKRGILNQRLPFCIRVMPMLLFRIPYALIGDNSDHLQVTSPEIATLAASTPVSSVLSICTIIYFRGRCDRLLLISAN